MVYYSRLVLVLLSLAAVSICPALAEVHDRAAVNQSIIDQMFAVPPGGIQPQPDDPFIDLLRHRLGHNLVHSFVTFTDGRPFIEAVAATHFDPEEILQLYAEAFHEQGHLARVTRLHPEYKGLMFFHGEIDGLEKRLILLEDPRSGITRVRFYSEQSDPRILDDFPSLQRQFPELLVLRNSIGDGEEGTLREYHHGPIRHAVLHLILDGKVDERHAQIVDFLRSHGWRPAEGSIRRAVILRKDGWSLQGMFTGGKRPGRVNVLLSVTEEP